MNLLVVTAQTGFAAQMRSLFERNGFRVDSSVNGADGIRRASAAEHDLIIIDARLPDVDGATVLECVQRVSDARVVFLAATREVEDRVAALDSGAHDSLAHPVDPLELLARARAVLRRDRPKSISPLTVADLEIDPLRRRVTRAGRPVALTSKEYALLECLARSPGTAVSRTLIRERVWDIDFDTRTNAIDVAVKRLRAKVDTPHEAKLIRTIRGVGYALEAAARPGLRLDPSRVAVIPSREAAS